jgi:hypothetical protein
VISVNDEVAVRNLPNIKSTLNIDILASGLLFHIPLHCTIITHMSGETSVQWWGRLQTLTIDPIENAEQGDYITHAESTDTAAPPPPKRRLCTSNVTHVSYATPPTSWTGSCDSMTDDAQKIVRALKREKYSTAYEVCFVIVLFCCDCL